jgi:hypothetical protein
MELGERVLCLLRRLGPLANVLATRWRSVSKLMILSSSRAPEMLASSGATITLPNAI